MASEGKNLVGVDIGSSSIKLCEIVEGRGSRRLVRFGFHPLPEETIVDGEVMNSGAVVEGLEKLFHKSRRRNVALRASGHSVIIKKIRVPRMTPAELSEQIEWEAEQHIPFDVAEVQIDHQVLAELPEHGQMDVLLVAAKKQEIRDLTNLAEEARLNPKIVDLDAFAIQNVHEALYGAPAPDQTVVLLHVGASISTVNVLAGGTTAFTRDIAMGGMAITEEIQRRMGATRDEAERMKIQLGSAPPEAREVVVQVVEQLAAEIQRSLDFYLATSGDRDIGSIWVSGGSANLPPLLEAIRRRVSFDAETTGLAGRGMGAAMGGGTAVGLLDALRLATPDTKTVNPLELQGREAQAAVAMGLALRKEREIRG